MMELVSRYGNELHHIYFIIQQCQISYSGLRAGSSHNRTCWFRNIAGMVQMRSIVDGVELRHAFSLPVSPVSLPLVGGRPAATNYRP